MIQPCKLNKQPLLTISPKDLTKTAVSTVTQDQPAQSVFSVFEMLYQKEVDYHGSSYRDP